MPKVTRKIIRINEALCDGCEQCLPSCPEQAIQMVDTPEGKKARLVKEIYCDGLGACLGACPTKALTVEERESEAYDEEATVARIKEVAPEMLAVHLEHLQAHEEESPQRPSLEKHRGTSGCPSSRMMHWKGKDVPAGDSAQATSLPSELRQWPVQLHLVPPFAPYFQNADLTIVADCVPFAYANFHQDFVKNRAIAIGCPKLDDTGPYVDKIAAIITTANPRRIEVVVMEVPCCSGLVGIVQEAIKKAGKPIPFSFVVIGVEGDKKLHRKVDS